MILNLPYEGATPEQLQHPMVREFLAIHDMFRREIASMQRFVETLIAGQIELDAAETRARVRLLSGAAFRYTSLLHFHHNGESSGMFPMLRGQGLKPSVITRLESEHADIAVLIDQLEAALRDVGSVDPLALGTDLERLAQVLRAHLAYEESHVCPLLTHFVDWTAMMH